MIIAALYFIARTKSRRARVYLFCFGALAPLLARGVIAESIHYAVPRLRPFEALGFTPLVMEYTSSFPSGHASGYFALATAVFFWNRSWGAVFYLSAFVNAVARVFIGVHWPVDVFAGACVGIASGLFVYLLVEPFGRKFLPQNTESHE
jgi:undecaprenyl-diphosphatase